MAAVDHVARVMGSELHIVAVDAPRGAIDRAVTLLDELEQVWSRFLPGSDISRLNRNAGSAVPVSEATLLLLELAAAAWRLTDGRVDASILPILLAQGYDRSIDDPSMQTVIGPGPARIGATPDLRLDPIAGTATLPLGAAIDPGGIGKGLAADLAVDRLMLSGAAGALVSVGGDLVVRGTPPSDRGWVVSVEDPADADRSVLLTRIDAGGVATSSTRSRRWVHDGIDRHHVIDPRTGRVSATDLASVSVFARSGWLAEVHATAALLEGRDGVGAYLAAQDLSGIAVAVDGTTICSDDLVGASS